jgi:catechol 2,3-dioxygenase-like lactoylglutathione lyase family enzyme
MPITAITPQLRTTDMSSSIRFYTEQLGFSLEFRYQDFYEGISAGGQSIHLKRVDEPDPSIAYVDEEEHLHLYLRCDDVEAFAAEIKARGVVLVREVHTTDWNTKEIVLRDDQGHTLHVGESL